MEPTPEHHQRIAKMTWTSVYPCYVTKVQRKGRSMNELHQVLEWLTGFDKEELVHMIDENITLKEFFDRARLHPNASMIKGVICGYRIENLDNTLTRNVRYMDKLVDELAKGRKMEKILRG